MDLNFIISRLESYSNDDLIKIILKPANRPLFPNYTKESLNLKNQKELISIIISNQNVHIDNNVLSDYLHQTEEEEFRKLFQLLKENPNFEPDKWKPRSHQVEHIQNLIKGIKKPTNNGRCVWDGSETGRGKTAAGVLTAIGGGFRHVLVICPDSVAGKWHRALSGIEPLYENINEFGEAEFSGYSKPMGLFDYKICNFTTILGTSKDSIQWAKYKPYPDRLNYLDDMKWLQIKRTKTLRGIEKEFDWSFLPGREENSNLGGTLVIWDEVQNAKGKTSKIGLCFTSFISYLHRESRKYIRGMFLSATIMEKVEDLSYMVYAFGYISKSSESEMNKFIENKLIPNFKSLMAEEWSPELEKVNGHTKLIVFLRIHLKKRNLFSIIPKSQHLTDGEFENKITFQPIRISDDDMEGFIKFNRNLKSMLFEMARNGGGRSIVARIQRALSKMEIYKLTPFSEFGRKVLQTPLPNGAQGSLVISMNRNASVRYFAWRFEAIIDLMKLKLSEIKEEREIQIANLKRNLSIMIYQEYKRYNIQEKTLIDQRLPLKLKSGFKQYEPNVLMSMNLEDLLFEYNKWIKYLDIEKFKNVCVFVGNFGSPSPTNFDLASPDKSNWIKESKVFKRDVKETMKLLFQTNQRRVFITNINIAKEGIDLHDISKGGMHPRTCLISSGIVTRYLKQMLGRVVRDGQTSDSLRIIGFVDNVKGEQSWEAKLMLGMSDKLKNIDLLHTGETALDIVQNINQDSGSLLKLIIDDIKKEMGIGGFTNIPDMIIGNDALDNELQDGDDSTPIEFSQLGTTTNFITGTSTIESFLQKNLGAKSIRKITTIEEPKIDIPIVTITNILSIRINNKYVFYDTTTNANPKEIEDIIYNTLKDDILLEDKYFKRIENGSYRGIAIYRPGVQVSGISQIDSNRKIIRQTTLNPELHGVGDEDLDFLNFLPQIEIKSLSVIYESPNTMLVGPRYPINSIFPDIFLGESLSMLKLNEKVLKFEGITSKIIVAFYTIRALVLFQEYKTISSMTPENPLDFLSYFDQKYIVGYQIISDKYYIRGHIDVIKYFKDILRSIDVLIPEIDNGRVFGEMTQPGVDVLMIEVKPKFFPSIKALIGNNNIDEKLEQINISKRLEQINIESKEISDIQDANRIIIPNSSDIDLDVMKIILSDRRVIYTPVGKILPEFIKLKHKNYSSGRLKTIIEGNMIVFESDGTDNRNGDDIIVELIQLVCIIQYMSLINGINYAKVEIDVSSKYLDYIPKFSINSLGTLWFAPYEIGLLIEDLLVGSLGELKWIPTSGRAINIRTYIVGGQSKFEMLKPYSFIEQNTIRFVILSVNQAEIIGLFDINGVEIYSNILNKITNQEDLGITVQRTKNVLTINSTKIIKDKESGQDMKVANYSGIIAYYIRLKPLFSDKLIFEENIKLPFSIKIVRNYLWTSNIVVHEMISQKLIDINDLINSKKIGKLLIHKFSFTEEGIEKVITLFSSGIQNSSFIVRQNNIIQIETSDISMLKLTTNWINENRDKSKILELRSDSISVQCDSYFTVMELYFFVKIRKGAILVSELKTENYLMSGSQENYPIGKDALLEISLKTNFGTIHLLRVPSGNNVNVFLVSNEQKAVDALLKSMPQSILNSITLEEIENGILGRKISGPSLFYIHYALDKI